MKTNLIRLNPMAKTKYSVFGKTMAMLCLSIKWFAN